MIRIEYRSPLSLTVEERKVLRGITLKPTSILREALTDATRGKANADIWIAIDENKFIGWCLVEYDIHSGGSDWVWPQSLLMCNVKNAYRRSGIGRKLIRKALKCVRKKRYVPMVYMHDERSTKFWKSFGLREEHNVC